jgi:NADPH:quinone reductase-like Zn-dependent oxidoreductase
MKAFALESFGQAGSVTDLPVPEPGEGQIRIRVVAGGLNPFDNAVIQGYMKEHMDHRFPLVPGMDASGTVDAIGAGVTGWAIGDDAFGSVGKSYFGEGTLAEFTTMSTATAGHKPAGLDHPAAAAIPVAGVTALNMVDTLSPRDGDIVVAFGATGGVGSYFVQLATRRGARVVAVNSGENADYARRLGAVDVVDYSKDNVVDAIRSRCGDGIQGISDMHGNKEDIAGLTDLIASGGRVVSAVGSADAEALAGRGVEAVNVRGNVNTASLEALATMIGNGELQNPEIRSFQLADAGTAVAAIASGHTRGKIVVTP